MDAGTQGDRQGLASALALLGIYTTSLTSSRWRAARGVVLTAVKQQKLEQRVAETQIVQSSVWPSGVTHNWRRQSHAQPKRNGGKRSPRRRMPQPEAAGPVRLSH